MACVFFLTLASSVVCASPILFVNSFFIVSNVPPDLVSAVIASVLLFTSPFFSAVIASVLCFTSPSFSALIAVSILPPCLVIASMACALSSDFPLLAVICSCIFANVPSGAFNLRSAVVFCSIAVLFAVTAPPSFVSAAIASAFVCITRLFFVIAPVSPVKAAIAVSILPPCLVIASMALALLSILPVFPATRPDKAFNCCNNSSILGFAGVLPRVVTEALELAEAIFMPPAEVNKTTANIAAPVVLTTIPPCLPLLLLL